MSQEEGNLGVFEIYFRFGLGTKMFQEKNPVNENESPK